jgi:tetratricopeptide (TPR) repeat protein
MMRTGRGAVYPRRVRRPGAGTVLAVALAAVALAAAPPAWAGAAAERAPATRWPIAVFPFVADGATATEGMGEALTEMVSHGFRQVRALRVLEAAAVEKALQAAGARRGAALTDRQLAEAAGAARARAVVAGSVKQEGDGLRVVARLLEAPSRGEVVTVEEVVGPAAEPFPLAERTVQACLKALRARLTPLDEKRLAGAFARPTASQPAYVLYARGRWAVGLGTREGYERATELLGKALELDGNFALARHQLGVALRASNNRWKAVGEFRKAIQLDPKFAEAYMDLGDLLRLSPRRLFDQAVEAYTKALELQPDFAEAHVGLGDTWQAKGNFDNAIAEYKKTLDLDPENAPVHVSLGRIYYNEKGQYHEAVTEYNRAIQLDPALLEAHLALGEVYEEKGLYQEAIARYAKVLEMEPRHPTAHYGLALAYEKVDRGKAIAMWQKYIEIATGTTSEKDWLDIAKKHLKKLQEQPAEPGR